MITVNGKKEQYPGTVSVEDYLEERKFRTDRVAVELNGQILPKTMYHDTVLKDEDYMEVVSFVGGG